MTVHTVIITGFNLSTIYGCVVSFYRMMISSRGNILLSASSFMKIYGPEYIFLSTYPYMYSYIFYLSTPCHKYHILCCFCHLLTYNCCMWLSQTQREESLINARLLLTSACLKYDDYDLFSSAADFQWPTAKDSCLSAQHDSSWWLTLAPCTLLQTGYECACKWKEKMHFNAKLKWHTH